MVWCFLGDAHAGVSCRLQVGAPPGRRSVLILPFTCPSPWLPAEYNSALPALPTASRRSAWAALCASQKALGCMVVSSTDVVNRAFGETPMRASPADCKSALRLGGALCLPKSTWLHGGGYCGCCKSCFWGDAHAGVSCRLQVGAPPGRRSVPSKKHLVAWWWIVRIL